MCTHAITASLPLTAELSHSQRVTCLKASTVRLASRYARATNGANGAQPCRHQANPNCVDTQTVASVDTFQLARGNHALAQPLIPLATTDLPVDAPLPPWPVTCHHMLSHRGPSARQVGHVQMSACVLLAGAQVVGWWLAHASPSLTCIGTRGDQQSHTSCRCLPPARLLQ